MLRKANWQRFGETGHYRDVPAAVAFAAQLAGVLIVALFNGAQIRASPTPADDASSHQLLLILCVAGLCSVGLAAAWLLLLRTGARALIWAGAGAGVVLALVNGVWLIARGGQAGLVLGVGSLLVAAGCAAFVALNRHRVDFSATLLATVAHLVRVYPGMLWLALAASLVQLVWLVLWSCAVAYTATLRSQARNARNSAQFGGAIRRRNYSAQFSDFPPSASTSRRWCSSCCSRTAGPPSSSAPSFTPPSPAPSAPGTSCRRASLPTRRRARSSARSPPRSARSASARSSPPRCRRSAPSRAASRRAAAAASARAASASSASSTCSCASSTSLRTPRSRSTARTSRARRATRGPSSSTTRASTPSSRRTLWGRRWRWARSSAACSRVCSSERGRARRSASTAPRGGRRATAAPPHRTARTSHAHTLPSAGARRGLPRRVLGAVRRRHCGRGGRHCSLRLLCRGSEPAADARLDAVRNLHRAPARAAAGDGGVLRQHGGGGIAIGRVRCDESTNSAF